MAYTKSAPKLQNFLDIAMFFGKNLHKSLSFFDILYIFLLFLSLLFYLTRYFATKSLSIVSGSFDTPNS